MPRDSEPLVRVHLWIRRSDRDWLQTHYGDGLGVSKVVRQLISAFRRKVEAKAQDQIDAEPEVSIDLHL